MRAGPMETLTVHAEKYPDMTPQDAVKLLYQHEFGGGHLVADPAGSLERLRAECAAVPRDRSVPLAEDIGNGLVRIQLSAVDGDEYPLEELNRDFVRSAQLHRGSMDAFLKKLDVLRGLTEEEKIFGFSVQELEEYLGSYIASGCPPVSHSQSYREAHHPAYRVVRRDLCLPLLAREAQELSAQRGSRVIVALDGRCAAGKTTLAARLQKQYGWSVVHMDHFFLRPEQRSPERYARPGGNVDHERFLKEVLLPLRLGERPVYRPFDCHRQKLLPPIPFEPGPVVLVEGSYACHPALWDCYDLRAFLNMERSRQLERIIRREGEDCAQVFREKWIPLEEQYFSACEVERRCDYRLET